MEKNKISKLSQLKLPIAIEIQTASYCNGQCIICPHRDVSKINPEGMMEHWLFEKIINESKEIKRIIPYLNNEPFLDPYFISRIRHIAKHTTARIEISTNLSLVNKDVQKQIEGIKIADFRVSMFGFRQSTYEKVMPGLSWKQSKANLDRLVKNKNLSIDVLRLIMVKTPYLSENDIIRARKYCDLHSIKFHLWNFLDRAGNVKLLSNNVCKQRIYGCQQKRPLSRMHVTFDGKVILCCMDWKRKFILGDLKKQHLKQVWASKKYQAIRKQIYGGKLKQPAICRRCKLAI